MVTGENMRIGITRGRLDGGSRVSPYAAIAYATARIRRVPRSITARVPRTADRESQIWAEPSGRDCGRMPLLELNAIIIILTVAEVESSREIPNKKITLKGAETISRSRLTP
jgi:hypothetical protein